MWVNIGDQEPFGAKQLGGKTRPASKASSSPCQSMDDRIKSLRSLVISKKSARLEWRSYMALIALTLGNESAISGERARQDSTSHFGLISNTVPRRFKSTYKFSSLYSMRRSGDWASCAQITTVSYGVLAAGCCSRSIYAGVRCHLDRNPSKTIGAEVVTTHKTYARVCSKTLKVEMTIKSSSAQAWSYMYGAPYSGKIISGGTYRLGRAPTQDLETGEMERYDF